MNGDFGGRTIDYGSYPYAVNVMQLALQNANYRTALWTGSFLQMTLMSIPLHSDVGVEVHESTDQLIRIEQGSALVQMGDCPKCLEFQQRVFANDTIFIPAGIWHNVINTGQQTLKLSSVYAPCVHPAGVLHSTKAVAEGE